jgi:2-oxo-4-hydroxy-4-carboxy-5-ureidoimidazoline decarboxylase
VSGLAQLDALDEAALTQALERCAGAHRWVDAMAARRPFGSREELHRAASELWRSMGRDDLLEAFAHHPRIGDVDSLRAKFAATASWASSEQAGAAAASEQTLQDLKDRNRDYEARFGYIFIVCATGKSAGEMLALLNARLRNGPDEELRVAAGEQEKILHLRLDKLLDEGASR